VSVVQRLTRIELVCRQPHELAHFFENALGFREVGETVLTEPAVGELIGVPDATAQIVSLRLGEQELSLVAFRPHGREYPLSVPGNSALFQHFAIAVSDVLRAYERLLKQPGWTAISAEGPQRLPISSGGVTAFKFRDPEGHPLELIARPQGAFANHESGDVGGVFRGINHSAISVLDTARSLSFYSELGLLRTGGSLNVGPEQERLDGIAGVSVDVTSLGMPDGSSPHLELLCYRNPPEGARKPAAVYDVAATRLVFAVRSEWTPQRFCRLQPQPDLRGPVSFADGLTRTLLRDPDGHLLCLEANGSSIQPPVAKPG
jgi:catechol 2,3-dioxygenase-like lactoylglutathione lyase family enzyme